MNKFILLLLSIPKIIYYNFRYLPLRQAYKMPILVTYKTKISCKGKIVINTPKTGCVRIGFHKVPICNECDETKLIINGTLYCKGDVRLGNGSKIRVAYGGYLSLGDNFHISGSSVINCYYHINIGNDVLIGWDALLMDSDAHPIYGEDGIIINRDAPIDIGNHVWIGAKSVILKKTVIPDCCIVACNSTVTGKKFDKNSIIMGSPAVSKKRFLDWKEISDNFHVIYNGDKNNE